MHDPPWGLPAGDLDESIDHATSDLNQWRGARLLVTGGTGFLGSWLVAVLLRADQRLKLDLRLEVLTRDSALLPFESGPSVRIIEGDVRSVEGIGSFDAIIHGAASSGARSDSSEADPRIVASTIVDGTRRIVDVAGSMHSRVLLLSSGAVYGRQTSHAVKEDASGGPDPLDPKSAYGEAKRFAENWCAAASADGTADCVIARLFAFVGPRLPLDRHFAAGNFLADAVAHRPVVVKGNGTSIRSYLYAGDLSEWLMAILTRGASGTAYNVGSDEGVTIAELAHRVASLTSPAAPVEILGGASDSVIDRYLPDIGRATRELALQPRTGLDTALRRSFRWFGGR